MTSLTVSEAAPLTDQQTAFAQWLIAHLGQKITAKTVWGDASYHFIIASVSIQGPFVYYVAFWRPVRDTGRAFSRGSLSQSDPYLLRDDSGSEISYIPAVERAIDDDF